MLNLLIALGALLGAADRVTGNRLKLGDKFEEGFLCMGPTALSMVGIICLAPLMGRVCGIVIEPVFGWFGIDPAMFGCILANNMGGCPLAQTLAHSREIGLYSGLIVSSTLGATLVYTIPVALGLLPARCQEDFAAGVMIGLVAVPVGSMAGGVFMGIPFSTLFLNTLPVALVSALVIGGFALWKARVIRGFMIFAGGLRIVTVLSLGAAAFAYISGIPLIPGLEPIEEGLAVVTDMCVVQLGSIPLAYLFIYILKRPLSALGKRLCMDRVSVAAFPISCVNVMSVFMMAKDMDRRGVVVTAAWYTNSICLFTAHYAYTQSVAPEIVGPMMAAKAVGGILAVTLAYYATRDMAEGKQALDETRR